LISRLIRRGVTALIPPGPWAQPHDPGRSAWWTDTVAHQSGISAEAGLRVPTLVRIDGTGPPGGGTALLLRRLARGPMTIVLTSSDQPSPFGGPALLRESWGPAYNINDILRKI
jgi:hypothetical protein